MPSLAVGSHSRGREGGPDCGDEGCRAGQQLHASFTTTGGPGLLPPHRWLWVSGREHLASCPQAEGGRLPDHTTF